MSQRKILAAGGLLNKDQGSVIYREFTEGEWESFGGSQLLVLSACPAEFGDFRLILKVHTPYLSTAQILKGSQNPEKQETSWNHWRQQQKPILPV